VSELKINEHPAWVTRGKTIRQLISELSSFENQDMLIELSIDSGQTSVPISLVVKDGGKCVLMNCQNE